MNKKSANAEYVLIFFISFMTILTELFFTRVLYFKAWNHVVYLVIPFAILGYGIGANVYLLVKDRLAKFSPTEVYAVLCALIASALSGSFWGLVYLPIKVEYLLSMLSSFSALMMLALAYVFYMLPYVFIGFLVVYLFSQRPAENHRLYFVDLLAAGLGAVAFYPLIEYFAVEKSLMLLALLSAAFSLYFAMRHKVVVVGMFLLGAFFVVKFVPETDSYVVDRQKGWEYIPGYYTADQYQHVSSKWHPLGRTDNYRIVGAVARDSIAQQSPGTLLINVNPRPEFAYFSTNYLAGTPVYNLSAEGWAKAGAQLKLFSVSMEAPYLLLHDPKVVVIGAGGGRDIFMAKTHGAKSVTGAEINPGIVRAMSPGGALYDYSGRVYTMDNVKVQAIDGRHLVKNLPDRSVDLVVLNGVDTFSGLSSGAYAYAESYLYTKDAIKDYLRVLDDGGMVNFIRWLFDVPRETLRLHAIALQALKESGVARPQDHVFIAGGNGWSLVLIKKTPFGEAERTKIVEYLKDKQLSPLYPAPEALRKSNHPFRYFQLYADYFVKGQERVFAHYYPYDISVITDDSPFFYKYYKLSSFNPFNSFAIHHTGPVIFLSQTVVFLQALVFILIFIILPLNLFKKKGLRVFQRQEFAAFLVYFACLGTGFMFIEISLMQKFVLLLGSPIYSITVVLAALLAATGWGSFAVPRLKKILGNEEKVIQAASVGILLYLLFLVIAGAPILNAFMGGGLLTRVLAVVVTLLPLGFLLGVFFPVGLAVVARKNEDTIAWAWGINGGFSVLGSILSIILAQFFGFNAILLLAAVIYLTAYLAFRRMV